MNHFPGFELIMQAQQETIRQDDDMAIRQYGRSVKNEKNVGQITIGAGIQWQSVEMNAPDAQFLIRLVFALPSVICHIGKQLNLLH